MGKIQSCLNCNSRQDDLELPVEIWCKVFFCLDKKSKKKATLVCKSNEIIRNNPRLSGILVFNFSSIEIPRIKDVKSRDSWPELYKILSESKSSLGSSYHTYENSNPSVDNGSLSSSDTNYIDPDNDPFYNHHGDDSLYWPHRRLNFELEEFLELERLLNVGARIDTVLSKWPALHTIILKDSSFLRCCENDNIEIDREPEDEIYVRKIGWVQEAIKWIEFEDCPTLKTLILDLTFESQCLDPEIEFSVRIVQILWLLIFRNLT